MANNLYIGVDLGGTSLLAAAVDTSTGRVLGQSKRKTRADLGAVGVVERLVTAIDKAIAKANLKRKDIAGVGIGIPGPIDPATGIVVRCENLGPSWDMFDVGKALKEQMCLPTILDNDVNVGAVGEHAFGAGQHTSEMIAIFVGTGVGGGIIINGKLYAGSRNSAGEVGHMVIAADTGPVCGCGERGCAEALCSRTAIEREIRAALADGQETIVSTLLADSKRGEISAGVIGDAWDAEDAVVQRAVSNAQHYLGLLVASCVNLLDPQVVVIGGGMLERMGDTYLAPVRETAVQHYLNKTNTEQVRIVRAALGDLSGVVGAAVMAETRLSGS